MRLAVLLSNRMLTRDQRRPLRRVRSLDREVPAPCQGVIEAVACRRGAETRDRSSQARCRVGRPTRSGTWQRLLFLLVPAWGGARLTPLEVELPAD
jgi:hypothetical protein